MAEANNESLDIKESDIVFDCPHCGKSLAIDYRGAGLSIPCSDCGRDVVVPIPEGMELTDIDSTNEEQEMRILNLRRSLAGAEARIATLEVEIARMKSSYEIAAKAHAAECKRIGSIRDKIVEVNGVLDQVIGSLSDRGPKAQPEPAGE